jgi:two-component system, OmpR family, response regulator
MQKTSRKRGGIPKRFATFRLGNRVCPRDAMHILLIEPHLLLARPLKQGLEEEGFSVVVARNGVEADFQARSTSFDAIVLDPTLPGEDGLRRLSIWRRSCLRTPVLVLTARAGAAERARALEQGADDCLTLPCELVRVFDHLRALTRPAAAAVPG